jgi:hypothetical protein
MGLNREGISYLSVGKWMLRTDKNQVVEITNVLLKVVYI